ncbi:heme ABC exporter ATP-binding protein CcmA [Mesobacillus selenatarsenatis]|uniref:ABC transporter involved in cytochrome c biogenesis, ATPase component CcmA n=1 Tax=Mesobacillus selenatarsenatis (strain DSM 18680 / JCM 14380 / FERM P-15431 / SF-1) TaxID=1321606 RepID=A0A0A8X5A6_MESS1|nr:heme ABC exporter ATP-binding protein CcmA [Mesobacillus selenatarsenatis]GAM15175.1 ABC transporter involved in cytochrome c biogenesis, ATPase component CcmA [Mesobacillus selenatarsenatis SF-1]
MLELKKMTKMLGDKLVLRNITLSLEKGEILAVIGPNGAGKSTFFKCTVGLLEPTSGEIYLDGSLVKKNSPQVKQRIGFLGHESFLYNNLSPLENLKFYGKLYKVKDLDRKANELLKEVGLYLFRDMPIRSFSRGMMQRLAIARVLLPDPDILMLDEPHTGLDQEAVTLLNNIIKNKRYSGTSILIISHDFEQVHALADRVAVLRKGKIVSTRRLGEEVSLAEMKTWYEAEVKSS